MPLDAGLSVIDQPVQVDPLTKLGITPIDPYFVTSYKDRYKAKYLKRRSSSEQFRSPSSYHWHTIALTCWMQVRGLKSRHAALPMFLDNPVGSMATNDKTAAPQRLVDLAQRVHQEIPDAEFSVDYFYIDPILYVHTYPYAPNTQKHCLGIWDQGKIVRIAKSNIDAKAGILAWWNNLKF